MFLTISSIEKFTSKIGSSRTVENALLENISYNLSKLKIFLKIGKKR